MDLGALVSRALDGEAVECRVALVVELVVAVHTQPQPGSGVLGIPPLEPEVTRAESRNAAVPGDLCEDIPEGNGVGNDLLLRDEE